MELLVFGLIALLIATGVLWVVGWLLGIISVVFVWVAALVWRLLSFIIPVAVLAAAVYFLVVLARNQSRGQTSGTAATTPDTVRVEKASRSTHEAGRGTIEAGSAATRGRVAVYTAPSEPLDERLGAEPGGAESGSPERTGTGISGQDELRMDTLTSTPPASSPRIRPAPEADTAPVEPLGEPETLDDRKPPMDAEEQAMPVAEATYAGDGDAPAGQDTDEAPSRLRNELTEEQLADLREDDTKADTKRPE
jgi:hypothetical protein